MAVRLSHQGHESTKGTAGFQTFVPFVVDESKSKPVTQLNSTRKIAGWSCTASIRVTDTLRLALFILETLPALLLAQSVCSARVLWSARIRKFSEAICAVVP